MIGNSSILDTKEEVRAMIENDAHFDLYPGENSMDETADHERKDAEQVMTPEAGMGA